MTFESLYTPVTFLKNMLHSVPDEAALMDYQQWWEAEGLPISSAVDRAGTPWLQMYDRLGTRVDNIQYIPEYWRMLKQGYKAGAIWRSFESRSLIPSYLVGYLTSFYDIGLCCPYTVSLSTAVPLEKYGSTALKERFLNPMLRRDDSVWQGATWMTEIRGGSDLGANVDTVARREGDGWRLTGDKYFTSNAGAEVAVVAAHIDGAKTGVRGLGLFVVPHYRDDGSLNYFIRRLKDKIATRSVPTGEIELRESEGYLLGQPEWGIYLILEVLNLSRVSNSMGSVALAQRALADALYFAERRVAFGKPIIEHPLMRRQFEKRFDDLQTAFALAWESLQLMNAVRDEQPPYSDHFHLCRLLIHLAKYWTAEVAAQTAKWAIEVNGGLGVLQEFGVERWLREAMIVDVWEGPPHRQILDGLEVMERKNAHKLLFAHLGDADSAEIEAQIDAHLQLPQDEKEAGAQEIFDALAIFTGRALLNKLMVQDAEKVR
ncbi:MAG: acyl-CoA dehydrogenase family protein [Anaerolineae bacterium]|nr:acyl-CoA dehydrogenase family protein [Anaerolineae bacterium]